MSAYRQSPSDALEESSSLVAGDNVCSAFFSSIGFPPAPGSIPHAEQQVVSHVETRASKQAKEEARFQLKQELEKLNITDPWESVKAYVAFSEYTLTPNDRLSVRDHIASVFSTYGLDAKQAMSAFDTAAQKWKITGAKCLRELGTDIAVKHGFPQDMAASFGKCFIGEKPDHELLLLRSWCLAAGFDRTQATDGSQVSQVKSSSLAPEDKELLGYVANRLDLTYLKVNQAGLDQRAKEQTMQQITVDNQDFARQRTESWVEGTITDLN